MGSGCECPTKRETVVGPCDGIGSGVEGPKEVKGTERRWVEGGKSTQ